MLQPSPLSDTLDAAAVFSGISIIIVNRYTQPVFSQATKPIRHLLSIEGSVDKYNSWCCLMQNLGFKVYSQLGATKPAIVNIINQVKAMSAHRYATLVVIFIGYSRKGKFICEDGIRVDINTLFTSLVNNPTSAWSNKPKCFLFDTWCIPRSYFSRVFSDIHKTELQPPPIQATMSISKDKGHSKHSVYLIITRNIPSFCKRQRASDISEDVITSVFLQEAAAIG